MWAFTVAECGLDHDKFWDLSWFEWSLYARRNKIHVAEFMMTEENHWARFRIQWADFRNAHSSKKSKTYRPTDLIKLSFDKPVTEQKATPNIEEVKRKFGSKVKGRNNGK